MRYVRNVLAAEPAFRSGVPILMYHKIGPAPSGARFKVWYVGKRLFSQQVRDLKRQGFQTCSLAESIKNADNRSKQVVLTFDDGYRSAVTEALPILAKHGLKATMFLVARQIGGHNDWDTRIGEVHEPLMTDADVREWLAAGNEIGSHSLTHPNLLHSSLEQIRREIIDSKKMLEDRFGRAVPDFSYPYGLWNPVIRDVVAEAGYASACTTDCGVNHSGTPPMELRRLPSQHRRYALVERFRNWRRLLRSSARNSDGDTK